MSENLLLKEVINEKNAFSVFRAIIEGETNVEKLSQAFYVMDDYLSLELTINLILNTNNKNLQDFLFTQAQKKLEKEYETNQTNLNHIILKHYFNSVLLDVLDKSNVPYEYKSEILNKCINESRIFNDHNFYFKYYEKYHLHINNENIDNWSLYVNKKHFSIILNTPQFINEYNLLTPHNRIQIIKLLMINYEIKQSEVNKFIKKIDTTGFENHLNELLPIDFKLLSGHLNTNIIHIYKKMNLDAGNLLKLIKIKDLNIYYGSHIKELKEILEKTNSQIKPYGETAVKNYMLQNSFISINNDWLDFMNFVDFKNKKNTQQDNFLKLTNSILLEIKNTTVEKDLLKVLTLLEKDKLSQELKTKPTQIKKLKI